MKVAVIYGGSSAERDVSIKTGEAVLKACLENNFNASAVIINNQSDKVFDDLKKFDIVFNALHGTFGEDGKIQKILKRNKFKVTHSNQKSSSNCFNKIKSKEIISKQNILTPKYDVVKIKDIDKKYLENIQIKFVQFILKPVSSGSSNGLVIIKSNKDLLLFFKKLKKFKLSFK